MKNFFLVCLFLAISAAAFTQSKLAPNARQLISLTKRCEPSKTDSDRIRKHFAIRSRGNEKYVNAFIHLTGGEKAYRALELLEVKINSRFPGIVTASIPVNKLEEVARLDEVRYVETGTPVRSTLNRVREVTGVDKVHAGIDLQGAFRGTGVVVGILDRGFEYGHPNFYNYAQTGLRIKCLWDQYDQTGTPPKGFGYGRELTTPEEILGKKYDQTNSTHGTHVAGIAAGADTVGNAYYGIAGDADIALVSYDNLGDDMDNTYLADGVKYLFDYAASVGKPCVVNLSWGTQIGPHDGTSTFDVLTDALQGAGKLITGGAGNQFDKKEHIAGTFGNGSADSLSSFLRFPYGYGDNYVDIWGEKGMRYTVRCYIYDYNGKTFEKYFDVVDASLEAGFGETYDLKLETDGYEGHLSVASEVSPLNGKPHVLLSCLTSNNKGAKYIGFTIRPLSAGTVHAWTTNSLSGLGLTGYTDGNGAYSVTEIGGTGNRITTVGAYVSSSSTDDLHSIATFSSRGPTADGRIKPDIAAPGATIVSSYSGYTNFAGTDVSRKVWNGQTYYYGEMSGTSMAAPCVAGILATWLQANPELTPEEAKAILQKTAIQDKYTGTLPQEGDNTWGYGKVNAWYGIKEVLKRHPDGIRPETADPAVLIPDGRNGFRLLFTRPSEATAITVYDVNGRKVYAQQTGPTDPGDEVTLSLAGRLPGLYLVKVSGTQTAFVTRMILK